MTMTTVTTDTGHTATATHILVIPYPAQGHMIPLLDLTHHLATTNTNQLLITVVTTPKNLHILSPLLSSTTNVTPLVLPFPPAPGIPAGAENTKDLPPASFRQIIPALSRLDDPLTRWFESHPSPPVAVISDFFVGWTQRFADRMGIKRVVFSPSGGMALSVIYSLWRDMPKNEKEGDENGVVLFNKMPNCPKYPWWQISPIYRSYVEGDIDSELIKEGFRDDMASWALVVNSFDELERVYLDHLMTVLGHDRVWAVGPLFPPHGLKDRGGSSTMDPDSIKSWLDVCRDNEVVYVSFGTQALLTATQKGAIAEALEKSGIRFIWAVRDPEATHGVENVGENHDTDFQGFEQRVSGRGMIIKGWAPQVSILRHRAVGTFLTHCGWNSVLEGLMAGVGMLAWPMGADQFTNATLLVDELKVGVRVCEGPKTVPNSCVLAEILAQSVNGDILDREKIKKLHTSCLEAVKENGSSSKELLNLVDKLTKLKTKGTLRN